MRQRQRTRRGGGLGNYWNAAKAGFVQGLKNAPKATARALKNSLKSRNSAYSSYASIANMRGSNINNIMSQHNENFRKAAGNALRPYTLAARNKVLGFFKANNQTQRIRPLLKPYALPPKMNNFKRNIKFAPLSLPSFRTAVSEPEPESESTLELA